MRKFRKYILAVLFFLFVNLNVFAFFVTDIQSIAQQIVSYVKEIENYYAEGMRWVQQVEQFKNQLKQIEKYYQQLQRLGPEAWKDPEAVLGAVKGMAGAVDKACGQVGALLNTSNETIEDVNLWVNTTRIQLEEKIASMYKDYKVEDGAINTSEDIQTIANSSKEIIEVLKSQIKSLQDEIENNLKEELNANKELIRDTMKKRDEAIMNASIESQKGENARKETINDYTSQAENYRQNISELQNMGKEYELSVEKTEEKIRELIKVKNLVEVISDNSSYRSTGYASMQKLRDVFSKYSGGSGKADYDDLLKRMNL